LINFDFETISTPAQLVALNEKAQSPSDKAIEALEKCDYSESKVIISWLLENCILFHQSEALKCVNSDAPADAIAWIEDVNGYTIAKKIIDEIS